jgi:hypothetical protein
VLHGGVQHPVDLLVDGVDRPARGLVPHVEAGDGLADVAEGRRVAQGHGLVRLKHQGVGREVAVGERAVRGRVQHGPVAGGEFAVLHLQPGRRGADHQIAGGRAESAHGLVARPGREAAAGHADPVHDGVVGAGRRAFHDEAGGRHVELFADDLRHAGGDALAAFHEGAQKLDGAVRVDLQESGHPRSGLRRQGSRSLGGALRLGADGARGQEGAEDEGSAGPREDAAAGRGSGAEERMHGGLLRRRPAARRRRWRCRSRSGRGSSSPR